ncbi:MAG: HmuY family protein [Nitrospinales bacterium]
MNQMLKVFAILLFATFLFQSSINYMANNIGDFENVALPPKKVEKYRTTHPIMKIDAKDRDAWTLVALTTGETHRVANLERHKEKLNEFKWDLGFSRTKIVSNSGLTNPQGTVGIINLGPVDFDSVTEAPESGYVQDAKAWGNVTNKAISDWYNYRTRTHNIESKKNVYVVRTSDHRYVKMKIINYYCKRAESDCASIMCTRQDAACLTIEYVSQPDGSRFFPSPKNMLAEKASLH